ncbi:hypothetical protein P171DRAFT_217311 [Karstenula rhodostoma CBS 690.94]|uniref:Uncharacterized protein n=1 Tax=Karstenula rhodostoma CBS 690.94 TaxID=1392251 RepID=A0A9P4UE92_9PLEO|nr:hypothetical protein P171DRAFT_217311 [Karstenula rhodostoma CBS 690.94]
MSSQHHFPLHSTPLQTPHLFSEPSYHQRLLFLRDNGNIMAVLKAVSSCSAHVGFCVRRIPSDETPSLDYHGLATLREQSRDEPPSPPPQPPPSPSGWSRPSDPDIVSTGSVGPCKNLVSSATNARKDLHPHIRVTLFPWGLTLAGILLDHFYLILSDLLDFALLRCVDDANFFFGNSAVDFSILDAYPFSCGFWSPCILG